MHPLSILCRGKAGCHGAGVYEESLNHSGKQTFSVSGMSGNLARNYSCLADQGWIVDSEHVDYAAFAREVCHGPMLGIDLPAFGEDRFDAKDREAARLMVPGLSGGFETFAMLAQDSAYTGLDKVGLGIYLLRMAKLGSRIGRRHGNTIVWVDGERETI